MLEGWVAVIDRERVENALLEVAPESYIDFRPPADDETPPTALDNPTPTTQSSRSKR